MLMKKPTEPSKDEMSKDSNTESEYFEKFRKVRSYVIHTYVHLYVAICVLFESSVTCLNRQMKVNTMLAQNFGGLIICKL